MQNMKSITMPEHQMSAFVSVLDGILSGRPVTSDDVAAATPAANMLQNLMDAEQNAIITPTQNA